MCPYSTLGVNANASEHEVKQAYRKLVLQYHPDINHTSNAEAKFMSIQQAYELLTGKSRHSVQRPDGTRADSAFHDWYWSFVQKRRWNGYKKGAAPSAAAQEPSGFEGGVPPHKTPQHQATLRSQLAGLRHRAAIRAKRQRDTAAQEPVQEQEHDNDVEYDSSQMGDGCNMASGVIDWKAAEEQYAAQAAKKRFTATESHREQVMQQMAGLHRRAAVQQDTGLW
eukprot:GHUV01007810.1.p1 GENE.GHUV01007810.1~~GHUV01007810.1.p1  ORF type:complete len:224 (+),score=66.75 GHUV01007810.1:677-1348(+)